MESIDPQPRGIRVDGEKATPDYERRFSQEPLGIESKEATTLLASVERKPAVKGVLIGPGLIIVASFAGAIIISLGHHFFLSYLHGRNVEDFSQFWIKNANNAFSQIVGILLGIAATNAMVQTIWRVLSDKATEIGVITNLFSLPSPQSMLPLLPNIRTSPSFIVPLLFGVLIQALFVVSTFAPNALEIVPKQTVNTSIQVPTLDFSQGQLNTVDRPDFGFYSNVTQAWSQIIVTTLLTPPDTFWSVPTSCGVTCSYELLYHAPALVCQDLEEAQLTLPRQSLYADPVVYQGSSSLVDAIVNISGLLGQWDTLGHYNLTLQYYPIITIMNNSIAVNSYNGTGGGTTCQFYNGTYKMSFQSIGSQKNVSTTLVSHDAVLGGENESCVWGDEPEPPVCWIWGINTRATSEAFASLLNGTLTYESVGTFIKGVENILILEKIFNITQAPDPIELEPIVSSLSTSLQDLFTNLTLGLIPQRKDVATVSATVWDGTSVWSYSVKTLWTIYAPALVLVGLFSLIGLWCIKRNGEPLEADFTTFLQTTINTHLGQVVKTSNPKDLEGIRLQHERKGFSVVE